MKEEDMASPTQEDLDKKRENIAKLRQQLDDADAKKANNVAEETRAIEAKRLDAEEERLQAQLSRTKDTGTKSSIREGNKGLESQVSTANTGEQKE